MATYQEFLKEITFKAFREHLNEMEKRKKNSISLEKVGVVTNVIGNDITSITNITTSNNVVDIKDIRNNEMKGGNSMDNDKNNYNNHSNNHSNHNSSFENHRLSFFRIDEDKVASLLGQAKGVEGLQKVVVKQLQEIALLREENETLRTLASKDNARIDTLARESRRLKDKVKEEMGMEIEMEMNKKREEGLEMEKEMELKKEMRNKREELEEELIE